MSSDIQEHNAWRNLSALIVSIATLMVVYVMGHEVFKFVHLTNGYLNTGLKRLVIGFHGDVVLFQFALKGVALYFGFMYGLGGNQKFTLEEKPKRSKVILQCIIYGLIYLFSYLILYLTREPNAFVSLIFVVVTMFSVTLFVKKANLLVRLINDKKLLTDRFNYEEEEFEQEKERIGDPSKAIWIPATLKRYKAEVEEPGETLSWNIVNPFAGTMLLGKPGTGKTFVFIHEYLRQCLLNGFTICNYDYKEGVLTDILYRYIMMNYKEIMGHKNFKDIQPRFAVIDFDDPFRSQQINPFATEYITGVEDCKDVATVFMQNLNKVWIEKKGEFFPESATMLFALMIMFVRYTTLKRKLNDVDKDGNKIATEGNCSTFPHAIALLNQPRDLLFNVLKNHPATKMQFSAFSDALEDGAMEQLSGQTATVKIGLASFITPRMFWVLSGDECSAYVSNPKRPLYLNLINHEYRKEVYGPALGLILAQVIKKINSPRNLPCLLAMDEFATVYVKDVDLLIATARSNEVAVLLGFQDFTQLEKNYGKLVAGVTKNTVGNVISGQVAAETARELQETFGKIKQRRYSITENSNGGASKSTSIQMDYVIPQAKITTLSQGQFVLKLSDEVDHPLPIPFARGFADIKSLGKKRLEHPDNDKFQKMERPISEKKRKMLTDDEGNDISVKIMQENYDRIIKEAEDLLVQEAQTIGII